MKKTPLFTADMFTPTKWETAEDKARFANQFVRFVESGYKPSLFPQWFYKRLSMCFGHDAHYNRLEFYHRFFDSPTGRVDFAQHTLTGGWGGDPAYTYSDVERSLRQWAHDRNAKGGW